MDDKKKKILLVEDDLNLGTILTDYLTIKGYNVTQAHNGVEGFELYNHRYYDLIILDIMMPKKDGFTLAADIRKFNQSIPIIFLSAKSLVEDRIKGLKIGGDDYITKPFSSEELLLRIENVFKRTAKEKSEQTNLTRQIGKYRFDYAKRILIFNGTKRKLTSKENELLYLLVINANSTVERGVALTKIWNDNTYFTSRSMDVYISRLRSYLKDDPGVEIVNVHGTGFRLLNQ